MKQEKIHSYILLQFLFWYSWLSFSCTELICIKPKFQTMKMSDIQYMVLPLCSWKFHVLHCSIFVWIKHLWGTFCQHLLLNKVYQSKISFKVTFYVCFLLLSCKPPLNCWSSCSIEKFTGEEIWILLYCFPSDLGLMLWYN